MSVTALDLEFSLFKVSPMKVGEMGRAQLPGSGEVPPFTNDMVYLEMHIRMNKISPTHDHAPYLLLLPTALMSLMLMKSSTITRSM